MLTECWRDIPGHPGYQVSDCGRVRSFKLRVTGRWIISDQPQRVLKLSTGPDGAYTSLWTNGMPYYVKVNDLARDAFDDRAGCGSPR